MTSDLDLPRFINGIPINPELSKNFDQTDNERRSEDELDQWWNRPYIVTQTLGQDGWGNDWRAHVRKDFLKRHPEGTVYRVRRLDGGAWDRSTWWADASSLPEAVEIAKQLDGMSIEEAVAAKANDWDDARGMAFWNELTPKVRDQLVEETKHARDGREPSPKEVWEFWKRKIAD